MLKTPDALEPPLANGAAPRPSLAAAPLPPMRTPPLAPQDAARLDALWRELDASTHRLIGYPTNTAYDYAGLERFFDFPMNNVGDPYGDSLYAVNCHEFEREVIDFFAQLYRIPKPSYWGYVTHGGTEGNMYGLYLAREVCPGGVVYFSEDTHYSATKIVHVLNLKHIIVKSQENGEMDYDDLGAMVRLNRDKPVIVFANIGTTMKGAVDDLAKIRGVLHENAIHHAYIHCDAALFGMILPFVKDAPAFDFSAGADSIAVSGHKFIGMPMPSGVVIAKKTNVERVKTAIEYIGASDTTIAGSRNALSTLMLWRSIHALGRRGFEARVKQALALTAYALARLKEIGWRAWANPCSNTIVLERPPREIVRSWQLAVKEDFAHVIVMPHVDQGKIDAFIDDLRNARTKERPRGGREHKAA
jgi:histidine decarboxylase